MAEGFARPGSKILCRYFVHGACREGSNCKFSHDRQDKLDNVCRFYLKGCCTYADRCRYDHIKPKSSGAESQRNAHVIPKHLVTSFKSDLPESNMVSLKKTLRGETASESLPVTPRPPDQWVQASEFVPGKPYHCSSVPFSYANAACDTAGMPEDKVTDEPGTDSSQLLCPFSTNKECPYGDDCEYMHGNICDLCGLAVLSLNDVEQNETHYKECMEKHEKDMELSFAVAVSKDKQCGICMDTVMEKECLSERRFGIMSDCTHCFCLSCIRKWRASKQFDNKTIRSCPECRTVSDFVTPSQYWVETKEEKIKLIQGYKQALSQKPCKYFDEGRGECPFNERCFYAHLNPDGTRATPQPRKRRKPRNAEGDISNFERVVLWDFLQERQERLESLFLELLGEDLSPLFLSLDMMSDSDDSDYDFVW